MQLGLPFRLVPIAFAPPFPLATSSTCSPTHPSLKRPRSKPCAPSKSRHQPRCQQPPIPAPSSNDFSDWSEEFLTLCSAQLELLQSTIPNVTTVTVFFRRENAASGALEFIPLSTYPAPAPHIWLSHGTAETTSYTSPSPPRVLPGGLPALWMLPDYPFLSPAALDGFVAPDGSLCVPIMFANIVAGSLVLCRPPGFPPGRAWAESDVARVRMVCRSISLASQLEGRSVAAVQASARDAAVMSSVAELLRSTLHQARSPVSALITFGRVLMQKLPLGDANRNLAKSIVVEGFRLDKLLKPLDRAGYALSLPRGEEGEGESEGEVVDEIGVESEGEEVVGDWEEGFQSLAGGEKTMLPRELFWVSDALETVADSCRALAEARGLQFVESVAEDAPPVLGHEAFFRECVYTCIDNALKYTPAGGVVGLYAGASESVSEEVEVIVFDSGAGIGEDEMDIIWERGTRGETGVRAGEGSGSGLGLSIAQSLMKRQGGDITLESPLPSGKMLDMLLTSGVDDRGPGAMFRLTLRRPERSSDSKI